MAVRIHLRNAWGDGKYLSYTTAGSERVHQLFSDIRENISKTNCIYKCASFTLNFLLKMHFSRFNRAFFL